MEKENSSTNKREKIISSALALFQKQGFQKTSVEQIVKEGDIAKGTFYLYFKKKEDVLDASLESMMSENAKQLKNDLKKQKHTAMKQIIYLVDWIRKCVQEQWSIVSELHDMQDPFFHYQSLFYATKTFAPFLADCFKQGILEGVFQTEYPEDLALSTMLEAFFLFDENIFPCDESEYRRRQENLCYSLEKSLSAPKGTFDFLIGG